MMDRKKLLLLYNPSAGRAQTSRNLDMLLQKFCTGGCETTVYPILDGLNAEDILAGAESAGYDIVVCCGGDGTLHHTVNGLLRLEQPPLLGYIPSGSTNDFASSLKLPVRMGDAAKIAVSGAPRRFDVGPLSACPNARGRAADAVVNGRPHAIDAGDFGGELFCYVAAFGAFSAVSYETPQNMKNAMGHLAYIIEGVKRLPIGEKYPARVEVGDQVFEEEFLFCSISNTTSIGGFSLDKSVEATLDDGECEVLLIKAPTSVAEANTIVSKLLARDFNNELIHLLHADSVTVHFPTPTKWTLDGEYGGEHTDVSVHRCLPTRCTWSFF